jgi:hypothetical protein
MNRHNARAGRQLTRQQPITHHHPRGACVPVKARSEPPTQLITFACPNCKELNTIKVERVVDFSQVASRPIVCAACANSWERILPGPICDGPHLKMTSDDKLPRRRLSSQQWTLTAGKESLTKQPALAVLILRLGASANALNAAQRMTLLARRTSGFVGLRDLCWTFLMACAQLKETIDSLLKENLRVILEAARKGGASDSDIEPIEPLTDVGPDSLYSRVLKTTSDQITYHWDKQPFESWRRAQTAEKVVWVLGEGEREADVVQLAAVAALTEAILPNPAYEELNKRVVEVSESCGVLTRIFQYAIAGYLASYGAEHSPYPDEEQQVEE